MKYSILVCHKIEIAIKASIPAEWPLMSWFCVASRPDSLYILNDAGSEQTAEELDQLSANRP